MYKELHHYIMEGFAWYAHRFKMEDDQIEWLKTQARARGISVSQLIREGIALFRADQERFPENKKRRHLPLLAAFLRIFLAFLSDMTIIWQRPSAMRLVMNNEPVFVDTSAFYALMGRSDAHYVRAAGSWRHLLEKDLRLYTSNYIIVETLALFQSRLGFKAATLWYQDVMSLAEVLWIEDLLHNLAHTLWLSLGPKKVSVVDCISFITMRHHKVQTAFAFDRHFEEQEFEIVRKGGKP